MSTSTPHQLKYVPITGTGVDIHENRKEHNSDPQVQTSELRSSISAVKQHIFSGMKTLIADTAKRDSK